MGKLMFKRNTEKGDVNYVAGTITFIREGVGEVEGKVVNIGMTVNIYDYEKKESQKKYLTVSFWNNDDPTKPQMADRVKKANLHTKQFVLLRCGGFREDTAANDGTPRLACLGFDFQFNDFVELSDKYDLIVGTARNCSRNEDRYRISVPVDKRLKDEKEAKTRWYSVTFFNNEKRAAADNAENILVQGIPCCVLCNKLKENTDGTGKIYRDLVGYEFVTGMAPEAKPE